MNDVPSEIWANIFSLCQPFRGSETSLRFRSETPQTLEFPSTELILASVCRQWRDIAHDTPEIWTFIKLHRHPKLVEAYFQRSCNRGIHLIWIEDRQTVPYLEPNFQVAIAHAIRWKSVTLGSLQSWPLSVVLSKMENISAPSLECLDVAFHFDRGGYNSATDHPILQGGAPTLQTLRISRLNPLWLTPPLSAHSVTTLCIANYSTSLHELLPSFSSLETLTLQHVTDRSSFFDAEPTTVPTLRNLWIADSSNPAYISKYLAAPNLDSFRVHGTLRDDWWRPVTSYFGTEDRSFPYPNIRIFELTSPSQYPNTQPMCSFIQRRPSIEHLTLSAQFLPAILHKLREGDKTFLPSWRTMSMHCSQHQISNGPRDNQLCMDVEVIQRIVEFRHNKSNPLTTIRILAECLLDNPEIRHLQRFGVSIEEVPPEEWVWW